MIVFIQRAWGTSFDNDIGEMYKITPDSFVARNRPWFDSRYFEYYQEGLYHKPDSTFQNLKLELIME